MKKIVAAVTGILVVILILGLIAAAGMYNTTAGQDWILNRALNTTMQRTPEPVTDLRVVVCGSASPLGNLPDRAQACIAVLTEDHFFLFDTGARSPLRIAQAQLPLNRLTAVFLTHFHSDHISALPNIELTSWVQGRPERLQVYGPAGVDEVVAGFNLAYRLDKSYRTAHHGAAMLPPEAAGMQAKPFDPDAIVWQDQELTITAFLVSHPPIEPAVGYKIEYRGRSVVISGDTNVSNNLLKYAEGADLVLHDALSRSLLDPMIEAATNNNVPRLPKIMHDVIDYHADASTLAEQAKQAGIKTLALYHLVPAPPNSLAAQIFLRGLDEDIILVDDLHRFDLPANSTEVIVHAP